MKAVTFTQFRRNASRVLDIVERGESVRILRHGKPVARVIPAEQRADELAWKRPGLRLVADGASLSKAILAERRSAR